MGNGLPGKIVFATGNKGKLREVEMILKDLGQQIVSMKEAGVETEIVEDGKTFEEYADNAEGIGRIGIIRADVDNLGQAFVSGFENPENQNRYVTLSRTAALSRQLSLFFKLHINKILENGVYSINRNESHPRKATI